jgi:hypothetical protein
MGGHRGERDEDGKTPSMAGITDDDVTQQGNDP